MKVNSIKLNCIHNNFLYNANKKIGFGGYNNIGDYSDYGPGDDDSGDNGDAFDSFGRDLIKNNVQFVSEVNSCNEKVENIETTCTCITDIVHQARMSVIGESPNMKAKSVSTSELSTMGLYEKLSPVVNTDKDTNIFVISDNETGLHTGVIVNLNIDENTYKMYYFDAISKNLIYDEYFSYDYKTDKSETVSNCYDLVAERLLQNVKVMQDCKSSFQVNTYYDTQSKLPVAICEQSYDYLNKQNNKSPEAISHTRGFYYRPNSQRILYAYENDKIIMPDEIKIFAIKQD